MSEHKPVSAGLHGSSGATFCLGSMILELKCYFKVLAPDLSLKDGTIGRRRNLRTKVFCHLAKFFRPKPQAAEVITDF